ncbi:MAG: uroporphyrinogen decarboxylase family protein [Phycisphaerae bacterium]|jgi:uroporphyrinogen decarboxylase|nr:uroporphyrinogen decarboxylase family protein [Phycisphaerae bacterium]
MVTHKERQLAAIRHEVSDRASADAIWVDNAEAIAEFLGIGPKEVSSRLGLDGRLVVLEYEDEFSTAAADVNRVKWSTTVIDNANAGYGTTRVYPLAGADSVSAVEAYHWPDTDKFNYQRAFAAAGKYGDTHAVRGPLWAPLFCRAADLFGIEDALVALIDRPVVMEAALERITDITVEIIERLLDGCGDSMPILCLGDDFATQRGMMFSPQLWRKFIRPHLARMFEVGKKRGKYIWFHSCGNITDVLGDLIDIGMDIWETVQLQTLAMPPEDLKREYGRHVTFFGGINTQKLPFATPDEIRREVRRKIEILGEGGGYICGPDHTLNLDVPAVNAVALYEAIGSFRG